MWYDVNKTLSYNCLLNFVIGPRGVGKTYSCKRRVIKSFLTRGEQFVYLRRYKTELEGGQVDNFFNDICREFPDHEFESSGGKFYIDKHLAGYAIPLSKAAQYKSVPFPDVWWILYDEFIIDQGMIRYLPNEVVTFNEMYSTIARLRDVKVLFLANSITFTNPYFLFYELKLQKGQKVLKKGDILLEMVVDEEYQQAAASTRFGKIISGTDYGKYAINNEFLRDTSTFIEKMSSSGTALFNIVVQSKTFTVYSILGEKIWYVSENIDPTMNRNISLDLESHDDSTSLSKDMGVKIWFDQLKQKYYRAEVRFTTMKAKNLVSPFLKRF